MALKVMMLKRDLENKQARVRELNEKIENVESRAREYYDEFEVLKDTDDSEALEQLVKKDEALDEERAGYVSESETLTEEIKELENKIQTISQGRPAKSNQVSNNERETFNNFLHKRVDGFTSPDGTLIIPTDVVYTPRDEVYTSYDLSNFVNRVTVSTSSGSWPILKRATAKLHTVEELAENPELAKPQFEQITYEVSTYRGSIAVSEESIDDAAVDLPTLIGKDINIQKLNTTNDLIATEFRDFPAKEVKTIDDIKTILNVDLEPAYQRRFIMSQSMYNALDQLKDDHGRYLIQTDIKESSEKRLLGYPISVVRDDLIGISPGDKVCFVGDSVAGITFFDRAQFSARWIDNEVYGQVLMIGFRCDVKKTDEKAGFYVTYKPDEVGKISAPGGAAAIKVNTK